MDEMSCNLRHAQMLKDIEGLKAEISNINEKVGELEKSTAINEEQTKMVFKILNEIKDSIKTIGDKLDFLEKKPADRWDELIKAIITVAATFAVTYFIAKK